MLLKIVFLYSFADCFAGLYHLVLCNSTELQFFAVDEVFFPLTMFFAKLIRKRKINKGKSYGFLTLPNICKCLFF